MAQAYNSLSKQVQPVGAISSFAGGSVPGGWLLCDGSAVSRTAFSDLFAIIGVTWGIGDGTTTFNLPDLRGRFLRGVDKGIGLDPDLGLRTSFNGGNGGDHAGSYQDHQFTQHRHVYHGNTGSNLSGGSLYVGSTTFDTNTDTDRNLAQGNPVWTGAGDTRPNNASVHYMIRIS